jgi:hypothetical protein
MESRKTQTVIVLVAAVVLGSVMLPLAAGPAVAQENNSTTDNTTTTQVEECEDPRTPQMDQARLYAPETVITSEDAGRIDGGFQLANTVECPVEVAVTLRVPSGMSISGGSDWGSAGAGMVTSTFTMQPGSGIKDLSGNVYSERTGELRVTGDIEYWPAGHPEMSQEIDGLTFNFDVVDPNTDDDDPGIGIPDVSNSTLLILLVALGMIGMMYVAPKVGVKFRQ